MEYEHLNGTAMLLVVLLLWALYKARISGDKS
jgi:hypothetical protein